MALLEEARAGSRTRAVAVAALAPLLVGYAAIAAVFAVVTALAARAEFTVDGVLASALPGWLAAHQVPLTIDGRELGALPLLPTLLLALLVGRVVRSVAERAEAYGPRETGWIAGAVVGAHAVAGLTVALLLDGQVTADPLAAFYYPALISGFACAVALAGRSGLVEVAAERVDPLALRGLKAGVMACGALVVVGAVVVVFGVATSFGEVAALHGAAPVGLFLLSVGYLPNAVAAGLAFAAGPGFALGEVSVAPLEFVGGPVPAVPLLGALPSAAQLWWPALMLLPAAVGALVGWVLREVDESPTARLRAVAVAALVVAVSAAVVAASAGGALAGGPFDPLDLRAAALSLALAAWTALPAACVAWFAGPHPIAAGLIPPDDDAPADNSYEPAPEPTDNSDDPAAGTTDNSDDPVTGATDNSVQPVTDATDKSVRPAGRATDKSDQPAREVTDKSVRPVSGGTDKSDDPVAGATDKLDEPVDGATDKFVAPEGEADGGVASDTHAADQDR